MKTTTHPSQEMRLALSETRAYYSSQKPIIVQPKISSYKSLKSLLANIVPGVASSNSTQIPHKVLLQSKSHKAMT